MKSLLSWERGLKSGLKAALCEGDVVAPLVGAWIEISSGTVSARSRMPVAPLVGAWIEILYSIQHYLRYIVAPLVGAWIEMIVRKAL